MEALIKMITERTGISQVQASTAVQTVVSFLKDRMPGGLGNQVDSFLSNEKESVGGMAGNVSGKIGDIFGR